MAAHHLTTLIPQRVQHAFQNLSAPFGRASLIIYQPVAQNSFSDKPPLQGWLKRNARLLVYILALLAVLVLAPTYWSHLETIDDFEGPEVDIGREQYIEAVISNPIVGSFDPKPIRALCKTKKFQGGLVWQCAVIVGGIGNLSSERLNCVRYAIEAGGELIADYYSLISD